MLLSVLAVVERYLTTKAGRSIQIEVSERQNVVGNLHSGSRAQFLTWRRLGYITDAVPTMHEIKRLIDALPSAHGF